MSLKENEIAPDFELLNQDSEKVQLSQFRGQNVVLYFYPKDDTPGCTTEACGFRDNYDKFKENNIVIFGVSPDSAKSHTKFIEKFQLPFPLLADVEHQVCDLFGVWGLKTMMGKEYYGVLRTTFVISPEGKILKIFENVKPTNHFQEILDLFSK
jgi:peroxiredoxin Q/BCP